VIRINLARMSEADFEILMAMRVTGLVPGGYGRLYNVPGGGQEMPFEEGVPPEFLEVLDPFFFFP
jgi:hypothetical protein